MSDDIRRRMLTPPDYQLTDRPFADYLRSLLATRYLLRVEVHETPGVGLDLYAVGSATSPTEPPPADALDRARRFAEAFLLGAAAWESRVTFNASGASSIVVKLADPDPADRAPTPEQGGPRA